MKNTLIFALCLSMASTLSFAAPAPKQKQLNSAQINKMIDKDMTCILKQTGISIPSNLEALVKTAVATCVTNDSDTVKLLKDSVIKQSKPTKNSKAVPTSQAIETSANVIREVYTGMAVRNIEYCAGMEKSSVDACLEVINKTARNIDMP